MTTEESTDGKIDGWPCNVSIVGDAYTGYDVRTVPYTDKDDNSAPSAIAMKIAGCEGSFKTKKACRNLAIKAGFVPDIDWGEMVL